MDSTELLNYALKRRSFLVAMWLMLQQRWFIRSFNASARVVSWLVIALGMTLVTLTVVTLARNVVPVLTTPYTIQYVLLQLLVLVVSFNIYVNYLCATAFSRRLGAAPAGYVYTDPYRRSDAGPPTDDSDEDDGNESSVDGDCAEVSASVVRSGDAHPLDRTQPRFPSRQHGGIAKDGAAAAITEAVVNAGGVSRAVVVGAVTGSSHAPPSQRYGGIQVVRVFGGEASGDGGGVTPAPSPTSSHNHSRHRGHSACGGGTRDLTMEQQQNATLFPSGSSLPVNEYMEEDEEGYGALGKPPSSWRSLFGLRDGRWWQRCAWKLFSRKGNVLSCVLTHAGCCCCCSCAPQPTVASPSLLHELESLAFTAERYSPRQRAYRILDPARRYCHHCRRLKAPREHHCAICNECVAKMDHHCPWINNCVGVENQRYFILFVAWLWVGTLLASAFVGYGVARQHRCSARRAALYAQWLRAPVKAELTQQLAALRMPYGPSGVLLTSYPTVMVLAVSITMCLCMTFFLYFNRRLVLENTTVIESIFVDERRAQANRSNGPRYRNPYDLGSWLNFLDMFATAGDPVVRRVTAKLAGDSTAARAPPQLQAVASCAEERKWLASVRSFVARVGVIVWLVGFPTLRPTHSDGVHFATFDALASGEQSSLLRS